MATIFRDNYEPEYSYFLTFGEGYRIECNGLVPEPYSVKVTPPDIGLEVATQSILDNHAFLTVNATKTTILADGIDSTSLTIAGQTTFDYAILRENILVASGAVNDGILEFSTDEPSTYLFELKVGSQTGYAKVIADNG